MTNQEKVQELIHSLEQKHTAEKACAIFEKASKKAVKKYVASGEKSNEALFGFILSELA